MQLTYKRQEQTLTIPNAEAATGLTISNVLVVPEQLVTWEIADSSTPADIDALNLYMADNSYEPVFP